MPQKTIVQLIDDLDGTSNDSIETITFGLDGVTYEIDLNNTNAGKLRDQLADFVASGRWTGGRAKPGPGSSAARSTNTSSGRSREQTHALEAAAEKSKGRTKK